MFDGIAGYYGRFRPPIDEAVSASIEGAVSRMGVLLDLGTGTGQVLESLGPRVRELVVGVDPDADMLAEAGRRLAGRSWEAPLELWNGSAENLPLDRWPAADVVTICRAFHWMDQPVVMAKARRRLRDGGAFIVMGDGSLWRGDLQWTATVTALVRKYLGPQRRAGKNALFRHHSIPYSQVLASGGFREVRRIDHRFERTWTPEQVLGYLYSTSFSAPTLYGDRLGEFETDLLSTLRDISTEHPLIEDVNFELVMGVKLVGVDSGPYHRQESHGTTDPNLSPFNRLRPCWGAAPV